MCHGARAKCEYDELQVLNLLGKGGRCVRLTTLQLPCADFLEILEP